MASDAERLHEYERSFRRAGLPLFSEDVSPYSLMIGIFPTVFGVLAVDDSIRTQWWASRVESSSISTSSASASS